MFGEFLNNAVRAQTGAYDAGKLFRKAGIRYRADRSCWGEVNKSNDNSDIELSSN